MKYLENESEFEKLINNDKVLVDFYATWCGPCQMLSPHLEELSNERTSCKIVKIDIDKFQGLAKQYGIMSVPTLMIFENGQNTKKEIGYMTKEELEYFMA